MAEMNLSLCGCGFLGIYHLGVAKALVTHGKGFLSKVKRVSGASAGSLIGAILVCKPESIEDCKKFTIELAGRVRRKPLGALTPGFNLLEPLERFLETSLPSDGYTKASGVLFLSLTNVRTKKNEIISDYSSNEELVKCLIASSFIPVYAGFSPPVIRGQKYMDGGMTDNLVIFEDGRTVTVSPFCGKQDISPHDKQGKGRFINMNNQDFQVNRNNLVRGLHALFPPSPKVLLKYYDKGSNDAVRFLKKEGLYELETTPEGDQEEETILNNETTV